MHQQHTTNLFLLLLFLRLCIQININVQAYFSHTSHGYDFTFAGNYEIWNDKSYWRTCYDLLIVGLHNSFNIFPFIISTLCHRNNISDSVQNFVSIFKSRIKNFVLQIFLKKFENEQKVLYIIRNNIKMKYHLHSE